MSGIGVAGGAGGIAAELDALDGAAAALLAISGRLGEVSVALGRAAASPAVLASAALAPDSGAAAEAAVLRASVSVAGTAADVDRLGRVVRLVVAVYREADAVAAGAVATAQDAVGFGAGVGVGLSWPVIPAALLGWQLSLLLPGRTGVVVRRAGHTTVVTALDAVGDTAAAHPWLLAGAGGGAEEAVAGVAATAGFGTSPLGLAVLLVAGPGAISGSRQALLRSLLARAPSVGLLDDGDGRARPLPRPVAPTGMRPVAPTGLAELAASMDEVGALATTPRQAQDDPWRSRVRVTRVPQPSGGSAWIVVVPGTQTWSRTGRRNPSDLTSNLSVMSGTDGALLQATRDAMTQAGIGPGEPVLVAGHSQGGLVAAALAADPDSPFTITHVYTEGSPIAGFDIPASVEVLAVEHAGDLVPNLDDGPGANPDTATWTTVTAPMPTAGQVRVPDEETLGAPILAHDSTKYGYTAALLDRSTHPSVVAWREGAECFFTGRGEVSEFQLERLGAR